MTLPDPLALRALKELGPHDHPCLIYDDQAEQFAAALPPGFLQAAISLHL